MLIQMCLNEAGKSLPGVFSQKLGEWAKINHDNEKLPRVRKVSTDLKSIALSAIDSIINKYSIKYR
jgi:hypothetical protein